MLGFAIITRKEIDGRHLLQPALQSAGGKLWPHQVAAGTLTVSGPRYTSSHGVQLYSSCALCCTYRCMYCTIAPLPIIMLYNCTYSSGTGAAQLNYSSIEEGREGQVTAYQCQWTQWIRHHGRGVAPVQPYSCPEMWL